MKTMLTMLGLAAVLLLGCGEPATVSETGAGEANTTTLASISPENKETCVYAVKGMT